MVIVMEIVIQHLIIIMFKSIIVYLKLQGKINLLKKKKKKIETLVLNIFT